MANTQDFTAVFKDMMGSFPVDTKAMEESFKRNFGEGRSDVQS